MPTAELRVHVPSGPSVPDYQPTLFEERPLTVREVKDWHFANPFREYNLEGMRERQRILELFCAWVGPKPIPGAPMAPARCYGDWPYNRCRPNDLLEFLNGQPRVKKKWTRRRWCNTIKTPFNAATQLGIIGRNPFRALKLPGGDRGRDLTDHEFRGMLRLATPAFRRVMLFLRLTGARPGELKDLRWESVSFEAGAIIITKHKTSDTQRDPEPRRIPLTSFLVKLLLWIKRRQLPGTAHVFANHFGQPWKTRALCKNVDGLRKKARLPKDVKLYGCRHTYATWAVINGVEVAMLAELLGHKHLTTTRWYLHLAGKKQYLNDAAEKAIKKRRESPKG